MKLVYKKTVLEQIQEAVIFAERHDKKIEKIVVTAKEWDELQKIFYWTRAVNAHVFGYPVEVEKTGLHSYIIPDKLYNTRI